MSIVRQDPEGLSPGRIALVALVAVAVGAAALGVAALLTPGALLGPAPQDDPSTPVAAISRSPIEQTAEGLERHRRARERLTEYGWADRDAGVAMIPIDRAMDLVARGVRPPDAPASRRGEEPR